MCILFKYDVVTLIELVESLFYGTKLLIVLKTKYETEAWREVYVVLEKEFDKDKKEQQNTVCQTIYQKIKSIYAHQEVTIKFGVVISKFFEKSVKTSFHIPRC